MSVTFLTNTDMYKLVVQNTVSGDVITLDDAIAYPAVSIASAITHFQSGEGTPSPDNIRPLTGWDIIRLRHKRRNLFDVDNYEDVGVYVNGTSLSGMAGRSIAVPIEGGKTYTVSKATATVMRLATCSTKPAGGVAVRASVVHTSASAEPLTITANAADTWLVVQLLTNADVSGKYGTIAANVPTLMIEEGATASPWEPYAYTLTAELPETVYSGSLDWTKGLLTISGCLVTLDEASMLTEFSAYGMSVLNVPYEGSPDKHAICSHVKEQEDAFNLTIVNGRGLRLYHAAFGVASHTELLAFIAAQHAAGTPVQVVYQLAEPYTIQLDPHTLKLLKGSNTIWSDCGDTSLTYSVDTKTYIDNAVAALAASVINA